MIYQVIFGIVVVLILTRFMAVLARDQPWRALISSLVAVLYVTCLFIPAHLQQSGDLVSKLIAPSVLGRPLPFEVEDLSKRWAIELLAVLAAEMVAATFDTSSYRRRELLRTAPPLDDGVSLERRRSKKAAILLVIVGVVTSIVIPAGSLAERGQEAGQGIAVLLRTSLIVGLSVLAFNRFFKSRVLLAISVLGVAFLVAGSVRSPLLVVMLGYVAGVIARHELRLKSLIAFSILGAFLAFFGSTMSAYRGEIIRGRSPDLPSIVSETLSNPFIAAYGSGIDTLDGYRLSAKVAATEPADPANLLVAITTFIPRAVWPDKPSDLGIRISARYLKYGAGGAFLSPIGYLTIALGGYVAAVAVWVLIILASSLLYMRNFTRFVGAIVLTTVFRLTLAGSPFDVYYGLTLTLLYSLACLPFWLYDQLAGSKLASETRRRSITHRDSITHGS